MGSEVYASLERFVKTRGALFQGANYGKRAFNIQIGIGGACLCVSSVLAILPAFGAPLGLLIGAIGPFIAGITNVAVALGLRNRCSTIRPVEASLTKEAKEVMLALNRKFLGRAYAWPWDNNYWQEEKYRYVGRGYYGQDWAVGTQQNPLVLTDDMLELLNVAAVEYNRVAAMVVAAGSGQTALSRMTPKIGLAADEGMADVLHQMGLYATYPEAAEPVLRRLESATRSLRELADRAQALAMSTPTFTERLEARSGIQDVLEELRMDQAARGELGSVRSAFDEDPRSGQASA